MHEATSQVISSDDKGLLPMVTSPTNAASSPANANSLPPPPLPGIIESPQAAGHDSHSSSHFFPSSNASSSSSLTVVAASASPGLFSPKRQLFCRFVTIPYCFFFELLSRWRTSSKLSFWHPCRVGNLLHLLPKHCRGGRGGAARRGVSTVFRRVTLTVRTANMMRRRGGLARSTSFRGGGLARSASSTGAALRKGTSFREMSGRPAPFVGPVSRPSSRLRRSNPRT